MSGQDSESVVLDRSAIEALIPHREPFLWLDEVLELSETLVHFSCRL